MFVFSKDLLDELVHFSRNAQCCLTLESREGIQLGKITDCVQNAGDVIIMKSP